MRWILGGYYSWRPYVRKPNPIIYSFLCIPHTTQNKTLGIPVTFRPPSQSHMHVRQLPPSPSYSLSGKTLNGYRRRGLSWLEFVNSFIDTKSFFFILFYWGFDKSIGECEILEGNSWVWGNIPTHTLTWSNPTVVESN